MTKSCRKQARVKHAPNTLESLLDVTDSESEPSNCLSNLESAFA